MFREEKALLTFLESGAAADQRVDVAFFNASIDGSGTLGQHKAIAYAGVCGSTAQWSAFAETWDAVLKKAGLKYLKMAEAMTWFGEFAPKYTDWGQEREAKRDELLNEFAAVSLQYGFQPIGMTAETRLLTQATVAECKVELIKGALLHMLHGIPDGYYVTVICDTELDVEQRIRGWMNELRKLAGSKLPSLAGVCFLDDRIYPSLQLADMVAWLYRVWGESCIERGMSMPPPPLLASMLRPGQYAQMSKVAPGTLLSAIDTLHKPSTS